METSTRIWMKDPEILLVDDDDELRESIADGLEEAGFIVIRASNGNDALGHLRTSSLPSLVLLDLMMPGLNGWELCEVMRGDPVLAEIPIVALSATASMDPESLHLADVADWIGKPFDLDQVLGVIRPFLRDRASATAAA
jgi:two-component system alkaline phosphatase synthesis response regulator PhoP